MVTNKDISERTGLKLGNIRERARRLGIEKRYQPNGGSGSSERVYTDDEAYLIEHGRPVIEHGRTKGERFYRVDS